MLLLTDIFFNIYICVCKKMPLHCKCVGTDYQRCEFGSSGNALISTCLLKSKLCLWRAQEFLRITIWITITRLSTHRNTRTNEEQKWTSELESNKDFLPSYSSSDGAVKTSFVIFKQNHRKPQYPTVWGVFGGVWWLKLPEYIWECIPRHMNHKKRGQRYYGKSGA